MFDKLFDVLLLFLFMGSIMMAVYHLSELIIAYVKEWLNG